MTTLAHLDAMAAEMDRKWGPDRLPTLAPDLAARWQVMTAALDAYHQERTLPAWAPDAATLYAKAISGWQAMDAAATAAGHKPIPAACFEAEWQPGRRFAVCWREEDKQALALRYKASGEDVSIWSPSDIAALIASIPAVGACMAEFPGARVSVPPADTRGGKRRFEMFDDIPFGQPEGEAA